jgi:hypothetical protein
MALFNPRIKFEILGGQSAMKVPFRDFNQNVSEVPSKYLSK